MIKSLKRKFIISTSIIVFIVSQLISILIISFNYYTIMNRVDKSFLEISNPKLNEGNFHGEKNMRYFIIEIIDNNAILNTVKSKDDSINNNNYLEYYNKVSSYKGFVNYYRYSLLVDSFGNESYILINTYIEISNLISLAINTEIIMLFSFILIILLVILLANKLFKPSITAYNNQKEFITNASHELKTPLTIISANNELIRYDLSENNYTAIIDKQIIKLNRLINEMIEQARLDENNKIKTNQFDLSSVCLDTASLFSSLIEAIGLKYNIDIEPNLSYVGDEALIRQLLSILLDNATKYCDIEGSIFVKVYRKKKIFISIINTYKKVEDINEFKIFERFYRVDESRSNNTSYGLGLSIAKGIAYKHKGEIKAIKHKNKFELLVKL